MARLLSIGADVDYLCSEDFFFTRGTTPLILSAGGDSLDIVQLLIDAGADLDHLTAVGVTALNKAASRGSVDIVRTVLDAGADPTAAGSDVQQPLWEAIANGQAEAVEILIDAGADPYMVVNRSQGESNINTLIHAAIAGGTATIGVLIEAGVDPNDVDAFGDHALNWAARLQQDMEVVRVLIDAGSELSLIGYHGTTALDSAVANGNDEVIDWLRDAGALTAAELTG
jgi:ankyrin repeat protein